MFAHLEAQLRKWQERYSDPLLTTITCLLLLLLFLVAPLQSHALGAIVFIAIVVGGLIISGSPLIFIVLILAFFTHIAALLLRLHSPSMLDVYLIAGAWIVIAGCLGFVVARVVFGPGQVNQHRIVGAVLLYLLVALLFAALFAVTGSLVPNAFSGLVVADNAALSGELVYFSFVTLTSTGYGDILPVHPVVRSLCNLETIIGQLYPPTLLARLVTLELAGRR